MNYKDNYKENTEAINQVIQSIILSRPSMIYFILSWKFFYLKSLRAN